MTVVENVQMALLSHNGEVFRFAPFAHRMYRKEALELLEMVGMAEQADRHCAVLAYGDLKRMELAIALAHAPALLLMDEPTAGMAPEGAYRPDGTDRSGGRGAGCQRFVSPNTTWMSSSPIHIASWC